MTRWIASTVITGGLLFLSGCGSEPPPPRTFKGEIATVETNMQSGDVRAKNHSYEEALSYYRQSMEIIRKAKLDAEGSELARLKTLEEELRGKIRNAEVKKVTMVTAPMAKPTAPAGEDIAAKQAREEAEAKKKADALALKEKQSTEALLKAAEAPKAKKKDKDKEEEEAEAAKTAAKAGSGEKKEGETPDDIPADAKVVIAKAQGPFPAVTDKSPDVEIPKMEIRGNYIIAYVQVYNRSNDGMRIDTIPGVFFKDGNSNTVCNPLSVACFNYNGFKADVKDPTEQSVPAITAGSHAVDGQSAMQFVAVGMSNNAKACQSVSVAVLLGGKKVLGNGPSKPATGGAAKEDGNLGGVNFK